MLPIRYSSWESFKSKFVKELLSKSNEDSLSSFLFRGQSMPSWKLCSAFDRIEIDKSKYNLLIQNFKLICSKYEFKKELMDEKFLPAFAQHYGLPTRLLDWTASPYFAAFFAFSDSIGRKKSANECVIWALNRNSELLKKEEGSLIIMDIPPQYNYRMKNQQGFFTLSNHSQDSVEEFDDDIVIKHKKDDMLYKLIIKYNEIQEVLDDLELMGITHSIAFPDLEGYIKEAINKTKLSKK